MRISIVFILQICIKSNGCLLIQPFLDDLVQIWKCTAAYKQDIPGIYSHHRHHGILAVGSYRHLYLAAFQQLQKSLLDSLSAYIPLVCVLFLCDLVYLIYKNNTMLCPFYVIVCCCQKLGYNALNIVSDISCLCQRCSVCNSKRYVQKSGQCLYKIRLTTAGRPDHQHVGLLDLHIIFHV